MRDKFKVIECYKTSRSIRGNYGELWDWSENSLNFSESGWWGRIFISNEAYKATEAGIQEWPFMRRFCLRTSGFITSVEEVS